MVTIQKLYLDFYSSYVTFRPHHGFLWLILKNCSEKGFFYSETSREVMTCFKYRGLLAIFQTLRIQVLELCPH